MMMRTRARKASLHRKILFASEKHIKIKKNKCILRSDQGINHLIEKGNKKHARAFAGKRLP